MMHMHHRRVAVPRHRRCRGGRPTKSGLVAGGILDRNEGGSDAIRQRGYRFEALLTAGEDGQDTPGVANSLHRNDIEPRKTPKVTAVVAQQGQVVPQRGGANQ